MTMHPHARRERAAEACARRFEGKAFDWKRSDCVRLVRCNLHHLGIGVPFLKGVRYGTEAGAERALSALGFADLVEGMDATGLQRIPPASAVLGDIIAVPTDKPQPWGAALTIAAGNGAVLGFLGGRCRAARCTSFIAAWSVL